MNELLRVYGEMFQIIAPLALWGLSLACLFAVTIPWALCKDTIQESQVAGHIEDGLKKCIFVGPLPNISNTNSAPWLVLWTLAGMWHNFLPVLVVHTLLDKELVWETKQLWVYLTSGVGMVLLTVLLPTLMDKDLSSFAFILPLVGLASSTAGYSGINVAKLCNGDKTMIPAWAGSWGLALGASHIFPLLVRRVVTVGASKLELFVLLFVVHPFVWNSLLCYYRHNARCIGAARGLYHSVSFLYLYLMKALYGWFLLFQLGSSLGSTKAIVGILVAKRLVGRVGSRSKDTWLLKLLYHRRTTEAILARQEENHLVLADTVASMIAEHTGILVSGAIISVANMHDVSGASPSHVDLWTTCILAHLVTILEGYLTLSIDSAVHQMDVSSLWRRDYTAKLVKVMLLVVAFTGMDVIFRVFGLMCSRSTEENDTILEFCPTASLF
ncbi:hypothetical protein BSKO_06125 [Bryopsis sp. KO-2023]|nr:hypothetical protein BSKO_06125 [Bryopsis sp. KO-2023]